MPGVSGSYAAGINVGSFEFFSVVGTYSDGTPPYSFIWPMWDFGAPSRNGISEDPTYGSFLVCDADCVVPNAPLGTLMPILGPAVPEPSTWAMMLLGFAGLGFAGYRRAKRGGATCVA